VTLAYATNGDKGMSDRPGFPHAECARVREREARAVARALGAGLILLGAPDEALYDTWENRLAMIEALRRARAELVFTHFERDYNLDHTATSAIVFQAALLAPIASIRTASRPLRRAPAIFYMDPGPGYGYEATHFVEIERPLVRRMRVILGYHASQMAVARRLLGRDYRAGVRERLRAAGARVGAPFAEAFRPCLADRRTPLARALP
jgi:LmbE family N-acetylglucosaminyl deacetylase